MPNDRSILLTLILVPLLVSTAACRVAPDDQPAEQAPDAIGDELLRVEGTWALPACARSHVYRDGRAVQHQCFDDDDVFSWENRGTLSTEAVEALDAAIASADLDATEPVNYKGLCDTADGQGTVTMTIGEERVSFTPFCLFEGIVAVYEEVAAIENDVASCQEPFVMLESVEPGCRPY